MIIRLSVAKSNCTIFSKKTDFLDIFDSITFLHAAKRWLSNRNAGTSSLSSQ
jgi:hypothetical protein